MADNHDRLNAALVALQYTALKVAIMEMDLRRRGDPEIERLADEVLQCVGETADKASAAYEHLADYLNGIDAVEEIDATVSEPLYKIMSGS